MQFEVRFSSGTHWANGCYNNRGARGAMQQRRVLRGLITVAIRIDIDIGANVAIDFPRWKMLHFALTVQILLLEVLILINENNCGQYT